jgi:hypothetical protein
VQDFPLNFKIIFLLLLIGCGVKKAPTGPNDKSIPSFFDEYDFEKNKKGSDKRKK